MDEHHLDRRSWLPGWGHPGRSWIVRLGLVLLPVVAAILVYYRDMGPEAGSRQLHGDALFYSYQMTRAAEVGGRWWTIAEDRRLGWPYQQELAKTPGLFEGVDLLLISTISARLLDPARNYHFLVLVVLAINGWVAGWLVRRLTGSTFWAAMAILLITCNEPTSWRITGHLHLFKCGWFLLGVWAFARYLESPSPRRGVLLGLAVAWTFQGTFYFGFFQVLSLGVWWLGCLIAGRLDRRHVAATGLALLAFVVATAALTFPIWIITKGYLLSDQFMQRPWKDTWLFGGELWQCFVSRGSRRAAQYVGEIGAKPFSNYLEGWNYPGLTVLAGILLYVLARLRGRRLCASEGHQRFLDLVMGQIALLVCLSLSGGPSFFLFRHFQAIRSYGRAGLLALVGLGSVAAPVILHGLAGWWRPRWPRAAIMTTALALVAYDVHHVQTVFAWPPRTPDATPAWVDWLAEQPPQVQLAAFGPIQTDYWYLIPNDGIRHGHRTLNGCDFQLLQGDLALLGAYYERMNQEGLRFIASLGYESMAFHRGYLDEHPWIRSLPWLERQAERGDWLILRVNAQFQRFPAVSPRQLLARRRASSAPVEVPPGSWITGRLDLDRTVVVTRPSRISLAWADAGGRLVSEPCAGLFQHVFGPDLPAYTVKTPEAGGAYELIFLDRHRRRIGSRPVVVNPKLLTSRQVFGRRVPDFTVSAAFVRDADCRTDRVRIALENRSPYYIQAHVHRDKGLGSGRTHPGMTLPESGSMVMQINYMRGETITDQDHRVLPHDLPPHGRLEMDLPIQWRSALDPSSKLLLLPNLIVVGQKIAAEHQGDVALSLEATPARTATKPATTSVR